MMRLSQQSALTTALCSPLTSVLPTLLLAAGYTRTRKIESASFAARIKIYSSPRNINRFDRKFLIRPPDLSNKNSLTFPIRMPMRVRHVPKRVKNPIQFTENTSKIRWNRLSPNQILLGFEHIEYLDFHQMLEGLRYLSQIQGQEKHDWNQHPWISKALDSVNHNFIRVKKGKTLQMYYLMKKLRYSSQSFWQKMYARIEQGIYDLPHQQFEAFFMRYYKANNPYFSSQMPQKFLTLMENRLRSFGPQSIIKIYQIFEQEGRLDHYWKFNVFVPLFKSQQYVYKPVDLHRIFRFMLILNHQKDDRLYASLYKRLTSYETMTLEEADLLIEVLEQIKDLFISHRVDPYLKHLQEKKIQIAQETGKIKKQISLHQLVRQDLVFFMNKQKIQAQNPSKKKKGKNNNTSKQKKASGKSQEAVSEAVEKAENSSETSQSSSEKPVEAQQQKQQ